jgi:hypothetical protein
LRPGFTVERSPGGRLIYRHGTHFGVTYANAITLGWMDVE